MTPEVFYLQIIYHAGNISTAAWVMCHGEIKALNLSLALRNLSSVNEKTRQQMRETDGLVNSLVHYVKASLEDNKAEDKVRQEQE